MKSFAPLKRARIFANACVAASAGILLFNSLAARGQSLEILHTFTGGTDGSHPASGLVATNNVLYGTTSQGATGGGALFTLNLDGTGFGIVHTFAGPSGTLPANPNTTPILSGNTLYGTTSTTLGSTNNFNTVYSVNTDGTGFFVIHSSSNDANAALPNGGQLAISGNTLFGTTARGGIYGNGTVYSVATDGSGYLVIHDFLYIASGANPSGNLALSGIALFGTTQTGGNATLNQTNGSVYTVNTDGTAFNTLFDFNNADGSAPAWILLSGGTLFGVTPSVAGYSGAVYALPSAGGSLQTLHLFVNSPDGASPMGGLVLGGNTLYGTTMQGGNGSGTIFSINTDGSNYKVLYRFSALVGGVNADGAAPTQSTLVLSSNILYGTTSTGGVNGLGTVFTLNLLEPSFFSGAVNLSGGVYYLTFPNGALFGYYSYNFFPYLYHFDLGFEYFFDANDGAGDAYLYDFTSGHFWFTGPAYFPFIYDFTLNAWLYYFPDAVHPGHYTTNPRSFYNFDTTNVIFQ